MLNNISILTEDQLDDAVDQLVEAVEEHVEIYTHEVDDIDANMVIGIAEGLGVNPTPQVVDVVVYRAQRILS